MDSPPAGGRTAGIKFDLGIVTINTVAGVANQKARQQAAELLGLDSQQARALFRSRPIHDLRCSYEDIMPRHAAETLRRPVDTGKVEWLVEQPEWKRYIKRAPEHWETDILETDAYRGVADVFHDRE